MTPKTGCHVFGLRTMNARTLTPELFRKMDAY